MKDLSIICVGYAKEDGSFHYEYKHNINWTNLEISDNNYESNVLHTESNKDMEIEKQYYINLSTKELIYNELSTALISIYLIKKDKIDLKEELKKQRELKRLKVLFEKHIDKQNLITGVYVKQTSKKMKELNTKSYINKEFDKNIVSDTYEHILYDIQIQINQIEKKKKKYSESLIKKKCLKNISTLLKKDYEEQKEYIKRNSEQVKKQNKTLQMENKNLNNFRQKAIDLMYSNGLEVDPNHK